MCSGEDLDRLGLGAVSRQCAMVMPVGADQIRQYLGVAGIRFRPGHLVALTVAGDRQRIDREHLIPRRTQRLHP